MNLYPFSLDQYSNVRNTVVDLQINSHLPSKSKNLPIKHKLECHDIPKVIAILPIPSQHEFNTDAESSSIEFANKISARSEKVLIDGSIEQRN